MSNTTLALTNENAEYMCIACTAFGNMQLDLASYTISGGNA
jgi:hypothetical protein